MNIAQIRNQLLGLTCKAVFKGPIQLASGKISDFYIDGRVITLSSEGLYYIALLMADMLKGVDFDAVGGPTMGADPIVGALCYHFWSQEKRNIAGFIIRKEAKGHGMQKLIEGPPLPKGSPVVLVEDVVTSGGSVLKAAKAAESAGYKVVKILALLDREEGAIDNLSGYDFESIIKREELV